MGTKKRETMNPMTEDLRNERGESGKADGLFYIEDGLYKATLIAEKRWRTPSGRARHRLVTATYCGSSARGLAASLRAAGWEPPKRLGHLCESAPSSNIGVRR